VNGLEGSHKLRFKENAIVDELRSIRARSNPVRISHE
jgi:hypothetical protein